MKKPIKSTTRSKLVRLIVQNKAEQSHSNPTRSCFILYNGFVYMGLFLNSKHPEFWRASTSYFYACEWWGCVRDEFKKAVLFDLMKNHESELDEYDLSVVTYDYVDLIERSKHG